MWDEDVEKIIRDRTLLIFWEQDSSQVVDFLNFCTLNHFETILNQILF